MYTKLLVPIDGSETAQLALSDAVVLAKLSGAQVQLLHIVDKFEHTNGFERPEVYINELRPRLLKAGQDLLDEAKTKLQAEDIVAETVMIESSGERISELIAGQAAKAGVDLIILGTHGRRGLGRLLIGSDAEQVARISPVPVLLVRNRRLQALGDRT
ncbi:universal stress protein [Cupriavidus basilensis]